MKDIRKNKFSLEPLKVIISEGRNVQMWFQYFEEEVKTRDVPEEYWGVKLMDLIDIDNRAMVDITSYETSKLAIMELYGNFKTILRRVYEIEQESNVAQYSLKLERAKRVIKNHDLYIPMANRIKKIQFKEIR